VWRRETPRKWREAKEKTRSAASAQEGIVQSSKEDVHGKGHVQKKKRGMSEPAYISAKKLAGAQCESEKNGKRAVNASGRGDYIA